MSSGGAGQDKVIFYLELLTEKARKARLAQPVSHWRAENDSSRIPVGIRYSATGNTTLASIGRSPLCDIVIPDPVISRVHCSFEVNPANGLIYLVDRTELGATAIGGTRRSGFSPDQARSVVVLPGYNDQLYLGPSHDFMFRIAWAVDAVKAMQHVKEFVNRFQPESLGRARTWNLRDQHAPNGYGADDAVTAVQSRAISTVATPKQMPPSLVWHPIDAIGPKGAFGDVKRAANIYTHGLIAVKQLRRKDLVHMSRKALMRAEDKLELLKEKPHQHVVGIIHTNGWHDDSINIAMELKDGNLSSLIDSWRDHEARYNIDTTGLGLRAMYHALLGLEWMHETLGTPHGSVAPHNILYTQKGDYFSIDSYRFVLADFGMSTAAPDADHNRCYMAPELFQDDRPPSRKSDIWSLYVTMLTVLNIDDWNLNRRFETSNPCDLARQIACNTDTIMVNLHVMARKDPESRWTASELLDHFYKQEYFINAPLPPPDQLRRGRRESRRTNTLRGPNRTFTRQSTMDKVKMSKNHFIRRLTTEFSR